MAINKQVLIYFVVLFAAIYQDFPLYNLIGEIGRSPIFLMAPLMLVYIFSNKRIGISIYAQHYIKYLLYLFLISLIFLVISYIHNDSFEVLDENIIVKTIKMSIYPIIILILYQFVYSYINNNFNNIRNLFTATYLIQLFLTGYITLEIYFLKKVTIFLPFLHSLPNKYWRVRLLTPEESWTGTILILFIFMPVFLVNYVKATKFFKTTTYIMSMYLFFSYVLVSESKGFLLLALLSILPLTFAYIKKNKYLRGLLYGLIIIFVIVGIFVGITLKEIILDQLTTSGTFGTRLSSVFTSVVVFGMSIIGVGWSGFVNYYPQVLEYILEHGYFDQFNLQEIRSYLSTTKALSTKSEFFDQLMYGGVFYLYFFYQFFIKRYLQLSKKQNLDVYFLRIPLAFMIMAGIVYITFHVKYELWFFLAMLDVFQQRLKTKEPDAA